MSRNLAVFLILVFAGTRPIFADDLKGLGGIHRIVFLGDSITYSGQFPEYVEAVLLTQSPSLNCEFINVGLPSETVSGLTEPGHAGGKFPRPDLHERLARVLERVKPDLVIACYGMNDGIYHPFSEDRFQKFKEGITRLREKVLASGAKLLLLTPPVFDPQPIRASTLPAGRPEYPAPYEGYDEVLDLYSAWLLAQRGNGWDVLDIHGPIERYTEKERESAPNFRLAGDGVHIDSTGHWLIARILLAHLGIPAAEMKDSSGAEQFLSQKPNGLAVLKLVQKKQRLQKDAWLTSIGHLRPGMSQGKPLADAEMQAKAIEAEIRGMVSKSP